MTAIPGVAVRLPVRVAAANDYEIVVAGLATMLCAFPDRLVVCDRVLVGEPITGGPIDVVLYDTYGRVDPGGALARLVGDPDVAKVAVFSLELSPKLVAEARTTGVSGFIAKSLAAADVCDAVVRIAAGEDVLAVDGTAEPALDQLDWPGREAGLSQRESQVLLLVADGLTNGEIATALYLSLETVKSHVRQVLRKLGLRNRVQAARYVARSDSFKHHPASRSRLG